MRKTVTFDIRHMLPIGLTLVIFGIAVTYGLNVVGDVRDDTCADSGMSYNFTNQRCCLAGTVCEANTANSSATAELNATRDSISGISKLPEKLPIIVTVIVAVVVIGILVRYLMVRV